MSLYRKDNSAVTSASASLRTVYGPNAAKKIARGFGIAVVTAKLWLSGRTPAARHEEIRLALLTECSRWEDRIQEIREEWSRGADEPSNETGRDSTTEGTAAAVARVKGDRGRPVVG